MSAFLERRVVLKGAALVAGGALSVKGAAVAASAQSAGAAPSRVGDAGIAGAGVAIVETEAGKVSGYIRKGLYIFKGVPYGDTTEGSNRFMPPGKPKPWTGIRSSRQYGFIAPQDKGNGREHDEEAFIFQWNDSIQGEDCLRVNVWTPGINDNKRRPVMVWLHGGGYAAGSGNDIPAFDGENLAREGDVVVVTLNHRLNVLGFLDLSGYDGKYAKSGNAGMLDIVAALEWVRDNIAAFGGDPQRVLIFGQSGGGAKVGTLMGMPSAKGLFHRAVVESGSFASRNTTEKSRRLADIFLRELGLTPATLGRLQTLPYAALSSASVAALRKGNGGPGTPGDVRQFGKRLAFAPVVDGNVLPQSPFLDAAPEMSADVPMIIGTTLNELISGFNHPEYERMTDAELAAKTQAMYPGRSAAIIAAFRKRTPDAKPFDLWSRIASGAPVRRAAIEQAALKAALNRAPAYLYWFNWMTPILDGRPRAFHCAEIPFVFRNTDECDHMTGGGPRARALSALMSRAWVQFAHTGNPNHAGMPHWAPYSSQSQPTMIFDDKSRLALAPDAEEQASIAGA
jgi:para-nitrobenzyl esterase